MVDEAGSLGTRDLAQVVEGARAVEAKVVLVGDHRQLGSVEAGGLFAHLAAGDDVATLERVHRQREEWERTAAQGLRAREVSSLDAYDDHGRLHAGDRAEMTEAVFSAWAADRAEGVDSLMLAARRVDVATLNARAHDHRVATGEVQPGGLVVGRSARSASATWCSPPPPTAARWPATGAGCSTATAGRWSASAPTGRSPSRHLDHGGSLRLPAEYVADNVGLGYAATVHRAQGTTTERCHLLADLRLLANHLYVALTRGRGANHAYVILDDLAPDHDCAAGGSRGTRAAQRPGRSRRGAAPAGDRRRRPHRAARRHRGSGRGPVAAGGGAGAGAGPPSPWRRGDHARGGWRDATTVPESSGRARWPPPCATARSRSEPPTGSAVTGLGAVAVGREQDGRPRRRR